MKFRRRTPEDLFRKYRETGNPSALGELFDKTAPGLFRLALTLAPDPAAAEDALQETFLQAIRNADRHDPELPVTPWLVGILRNRVLMAKRSAARVPDPTRLEPRLPFPEPASNATRNERHERVRKALLDLPEPYRQVALLRWRYGLEPSEIAEVRGVPPGTVWSLLSRAREKLKTALEGAPALALLMRPPRGFDAVREAVVRAVASSKPYVAATVVVGGAFMAKKAVLLGAILVLLAGGLIALRELDRDRAATPRAPEAGRDASSAVQPGDADDEPAPVPAGDGAVVGRLVRGTPGRPIKGTVAAGAFSVKTGADGRFRLEGLARRTPFELAASSAGLVTVRLRDLKIPARGVLDLGDLTLGPDIPLDVVVVDRGGVPVPDAQVLLYRQRRGLPAWRQPPTFEVPRRPQVDVSGTTGVKGTVTLRPVTPGTWVVAVEAAGFATRVRNVNVQEELARDPLRIVLRPACTLEGRVFGRDGKPLKGVAVMGDGDRLAGPAFTDDSGRYRLDGLARGTWTLEVQVSSTTRKSGGVVDVPQVQSYDIHLHGGATVKGVVKDAVTREPVAGAQVTFGVFRMGDGDRAQYRLLSGEDGRFQVDHVPSGIVFENGMQILKDGYLPWPDRNTDRKGARGNLKPGVVYEREALLRKGAVVRGRVTGPDGEPIEGASVRVTGLNWRMAPARSGPDGAYAVHGVDHGTGVLQVSANGWYQPELPVDIWRALRDGSVPQRWRVDVPESGETTRDAVLGRAVTVSGIVVDAEGAPVAGAKVTVGTGRISWEPAATGPDGTFTAPNVRPEVEAVATAEAPGGRQGKSAPFRAPATGVRVMVAAGATLAGAVRRADGGDVKGVHLRLFTGTYDPRRPGPTAHQTLAVAADGAFAAEGLPPGRYTFVCTADGCGEVIGPTVDVAAGETMDDLEIALPAELTITGVVRGPKGEPVAGALVSARATKEGQNSYFANERFNVNAVSDMQGRFVQHGLSPGKYLLTVRTQKFLEKTVAARAGDSNLAVKLTTGESISGIVVEKGTGRPLANVRVNSQAQKPDARFLNNVQADTGPDGRFELNGLAPGGYMVWTYTGDRGYVPVNLYHIKTGTTGLRIELERGLAITGRLLKADGEPASEGVAISATGRRPDGTRDTSRRGWAETGLDGTFSFQGLAPGAYDLVVRPMYSGGVGTQAKKENVAAGTEGVVIRLPRGEPISGRVERADGKALDRRGMLVVRPSEAGGNEGVWVGVNADGTFTTPSLELGKTYDIAPRQFGGAVGGVVHKVRPGATGVVIRLETAKRIRGTVVDEAGAAVPAGVPVVATAIGVKGEYFETPGSRQTAVTGRDGAFVLDGLGDFRFRVVAGGHNTDYAALRADPLRPRDAPITLRVRKGHALQGKLMDATGKPMARVRLTAAKRWTETADDGTFTLRGLPAGEVPITARIGGKNVDVGTHSAPATGVELRTP